MARILQLGFVSTVGASITISVGNRQSVPEIGRLKGEGLLEGIRPTTSGNIAGSATGVTVFLRLIYLRSFSQLFLEEGSDEVDDTLELLVALLLSVLEPTGDMALDEWHRHCI